jgi:hypothetical protein
MIAFVVTVGVIVFEFRGCFQKTGIMQLGSLSMDPALSNYDTVVTTDMRKYKKEMRNIILANSLTIYELKSRAKAMPDGAQAEFFKKIDVLEQRNTELRNRIRTHTISGSDNWNEVKSQFSRDIYSLDDAFKDLAAGITNSSSAEE